MHLPRPLPLLIVAGVLATIAACGSAATQPSPPATAGPTPTPAGADAPTPTPVTVVVDSPADAASLVLAMNPLFAGAAQQDPNIIGQSRYWVATPLADGRYRIEVTIGWGDCPAGCIDRHVWSYEVWPDGRVELIGETGPEVPPDLR